MKPFAYRFLLALLCLGWAGPLAAQSSEQMSVALSSPGKPGVLHLKLVGGSINVTGYSGKEVVIEATPRSGGSRPGRAPGPPSPPNTPMPPTGGGEGAGMRRLSQVQGMEITAQEKSNHVYVNSDSWQRPIDFTVKVPRQFSLQVSTVNSGNITVQNVSGELEISNVNGSIALEDVAGSAVVSTVNGRVVANFRDVTPNAPMAFSSVNGKLDVTLPAKTKAAFKLKSDRGEIYSDFDMTVDASAPKVNRSSKDGVYRVSTDNWTYGKINGGGAEVMMQTMNGNIYIRKAK
ncbi:DUF4097 family beta strand repeat-containing protein [Solirubrum puertoriconensis]|uniref:DUF4097 domain-containing protein n=1 Tax=Solirubrum puertoriconensis TaxID=1751427 RepID=A0A9X0HLG1_SOLP1|nr:DUF4097 family beta strand repeat-containing protein [Solirubrum puertoriconensis]KUG08143.1 hypothetical protein ASU33_08080 [Solirubrum puertoriconensis]